MPSLIDCHRRSQQIPYAKQKLFVQWSLDFVVEKTLVCALLCSRCLRHWWLKAVQHQGQLQTRLFEEEKKTVRQSSIAVFKKVKYP